MIKIAKPFIGTQHLNQRYGKKDPMYSVIGLLGHNGFDFALPIGTPVIACLDGVVLSIAEDNAIERGYPTRGIGVEILHNVGGMTFKSLYWHLNGKNNVFVTVGQAVKQGQVIAQSGNTGYSTGAHLHFAIKMTDAQGNTLNRDNGTAGAIDTTTWYNVPITSPIKVTLKKGSKGDEVKTLQTFLAYFGYLSQGNITGYFGQKTSDALAKMQVIMIGEENMQPKYVENDLSQGNAICGRITRDLINRFI